METPAPEPAKVEEVPPPTGWRAVWRHITNWAEVYLWVPCALLSIWIFAKVAYLFTGRRPQENADWIVGLGGNLVKCVFLIVILSIVRQQTGVWWKREELIANKHLAYAQTISSCVALIVFAYLLSH